MNDFCIVGSGLQGCCIALELAHRGKNVTLIERDKYIYNRASLRNEGKIHLGLVYMNSPNFETPAIMLRGALLFRKYLERWIGDKSHDLGLSEPFYYIVAKDSFLNPEQLGEGYARLQALFEAWQTEHPDWDYLGERPLRLFERASEKELDDYFGKGALQGGFKTAELAIDTSKLREHIVDAVMSNERIRVLNECFVHQIELENEAYSLHITGPDGKHIERAHSVVNCAWDGKYCIDQQMGLSVPGQLLHRLKYRVVVKLPEALAHRPSATMVIGKYGDVVNQKNGNAYLSWYPSACIGWSHDVSPPADWEQPAQGNVDSALAQQLASEFLENIETWYPGIKQSSVVVVDAGPIVAYGQTDVDDAESKLHDRSGIGFKRVGNYHSIETGKLTTAPMLAVEFVNSILGE